MSGGTLVISDCLFADNANLQADGVAGTGGALECDLMTSFNMTGSRLERNTAFEAGAATITGEILALSSCEIVDNTGEYGNGGLTGEGQIAFNGTGSLNLQSSIVAYGAGGGALTSLSGEYLTLTVSCTDVYGNPGGDWTGSLAPFDGVAGNLEAKPWFCDPDAGDYRLAGDSPCAATENTCGVTMGAYPAECVNVSGVGDAPTLLAVALHQNHPNPFNPVTRIRFELPRETAVSLRVYDVAGRMVRELLDGEVLPVGSHGVTWNGRDDAVRDQAAGTYLYRLQAGEVDFVRKMALIRWLIGTSEAPRTRACGPGDNDASS